ncbi:MAG TPA: Hsp20/alpha crystallin family protein [Desulfuromonadales bacterium]|nr:Hsp20/alpha crystallin family protein [Desulfuromonadales bacterium]
MAGKEEKKQKSELEVMPGANRWGLAPFDEMERWFDDFFRRPFLTSSWLPRVRFPEIGEITPSVDVYEDKNDVVVKAEIPGMKKEDITVSISDEVMTISGEKKAEENVEKKNYHRIERSFGSFTRRLRLPPGIQEDKVKAVFRDGILEVRIPRTEAAKQKARQIKIE